jgi:hypothetical protein
MGMRWPLRRRVDGTSLPALRRPPAREPGRRRPRLLFEQLERREVPAAVPLATLGLGIELFADNSGVPSTTPMTSATVTAGETFWIGVVVQDQRSTGTPQGIISLPLNLSWDVDELPPVSPPATFTPTDLAPDDPLLTADFPLDRLVDSYNPTAPDGHTGLGSVSAGTTVAIPTVPTLASLRGAALPMADLGSAIGVAPNSVFSEIRVTAAAVTTQTTTPFTLQLAGSMSFADAASLAGLNELISPDTTPPTTGTSPPDPQLNSDALAITDFITINPATTTGPISLSGYVYADTNLNGKLDRDSSGVPTEIGLPNVTVTLDGPGGTQTTTTGLDGSYAFQNLAAGTYQVVLTQPAGFIADTSNQVGVVLPGNTTDGTAGPNEFTDITLAAGQQGIDYNFGENAVPSKLLFLASSQPQQQFFSNLGVNSVTVNTTGNVVVSATASQLNVAVNGGTPQSYSRSSVNAVIINSQGGQGTVTVNAAEAGQTANLLPGFGSVRDGSDYQNGHYGVLVMGPMKLSVTGTLGNANLAVLRTVPGNNALVSSGSTATLTSPAGKIASVTGFDTVVAQAAGYGPMPNNTSKATALGFNLELAGSWTSI